MDDPLDSRQLRTFALVAKTGSFTETARQLCLTHSAVSHAMAALERIVGCRLLNRVSKKIILTEAGEALLHHAEGILAELGQARLTLEHLNKWGYRRLRLGVQNGFPSEFLGRVLARFRAQFPRLSLEITTYREPDPHAFGAGCSDLFLGEADAALEPFTFLRLFAEPYRIVVAAAHPWASLGRVPRDELPRQPFACWAPFPSVRRRLERYFARERLVLNCVFVTETVETLRHFLKLTECFSIIPASSVREQLRDSSLVSFPVGRTGLDQEWSLLHRRSHPLNPAEVGFVKLCQDPGAEEIVPVAPGTIAFNVKT